MNLRLARPAMLAALLGLALAAAGCDPAPKGDASLVPTLPRSFLLHQLHQLEGQNLFEGDAPGRARAIVEQLGLDEEPPPWFVWRMSDSKAEPVTVLLLMDPRMAFPGAARLRVVVWDEHGTQLSRAPDFDVVWRAGIRSARLMRDPEGRDVIEIVTNVRVETRQYYAIIDGEAALVRLEGHQRRNEYVYTKRTIGPPVAVVDRATCLAKLGSTDPFVVLELLMWLTADHGPPEILDLPPGYLEPEAIRLHVRQLLTDAEVIAAVRHLLQTFKHPWVRDAAHEALRLGAELTW